MEEEIPKVKGHAIFSAKRTLKNYVDSETYDKIFSKLTPEVRSAINSPSLSSMWYPEMIFADFILAIVKVIGLKESKKLANQIAKEEMKGIYNFVLGALASPKMIAKNGPKLWRSIHTTGDLTVNEITDVRQTLTIENYDFINYEYTIIFIAYHSAMLEMVGCRNVIGNFKKISDKKYVFTFNWMK